LQRDDDKEHLEHDQITATCRTAELWIPWIARKYATIAALILHILGAHHQKIDETTITGLMTGCCRPTSIDIPSAFHIAKDQKRVFRIRKL